MKILDAKKRGNVIRLYLGADTLEDWTGDDWNDVSYENNAGTVYDEYVSATADIAFPYDWGVAEPGGGWQESGLSRDAFKNGRIPMIVAAPPDERETWWDYSDYKTILESKSVIAFCMGDRLDLDDKLPDGVRIISEPVCVRFGLAEIRKEV